MHADRCASSRDGAARDAAAAAAPTGRWIGVLGADRRWSASAAYWRPAARRPGRHRHERPRVVGPLHRQLHLPGRPRRGGGDDGDPRLPLPRPGRARRSCSSASSWPSPRSSCACCSCVVDLGRPDRFWHMIPGIGRFNWPISMLTWDVIVLNGYLLLNLAICRYLLYSRYRGREPDPQLYVPFVVPLDRLGDLDPHRHGVPLLGAAARPFWNTALLGAALPGVGLRRRARRSSSCCCRSIRRVTDYPVEQTRHRHAGADHHGGAADQPVPARRRAVHRVLHGSTPRRPRATSSSGWTGTRALRAVDLDARIALNLVAVLHPVDPPAARADAAR